LRFYLHLEVSARRYFTIDLHIPVRAKARATPAPRGWVAVGRLRGAQTAA
jgi:hypothetical protein